MDIQSLPLSKDRFARTWKVLQDGIDQGVAPGMAAGIFSVREPDKMYLGALGSRRVLPSPQPMTLETVFDLASLTKVIGTSTLTALLVDRGWLKWDQKVHSILPEFPYPQIEIRHLLSHTAGYIDWKPLWQELRDHFLPARLETISTGERQAQMRRLVLAVPVDRLIEERALYSDFSMLLMGFVLEEVLKIPLDQAITRYVWRAMGIPGLYFRRVLANADQGRDESAVATELDEWRGGMVQGQVHDENCWSMGGYSGHAGAFGRLSDVVEFAAGLMTTSFLSPKVLREMWTRVLLPPGCERTLGWDTPSANQASCGDRFSAQTVGHLGFTGTSLWMDPQKGIAVILLTNRVHPTRENILIRAFRPRFHNAILDDFFDS